MDNRTKEPNNKADLKKDEKRLFQLKELDDYKVASDAPDVRGWSVVDGEQHEFGTVSGLIVDPGQEKVRYLDVLAKNEPNQKEENHLLIPIGVARIEEADKRIMVNAINADLLKAYPSHKGNDISRDFEYEIVERFNRPVEGTPRRRAETAEDSEFYNNEFYDEDRFYTNKNKNK